MKTKPRFTVRESRDWSYGHEHVYYWVTDARGGEACGWVATRAWARDIARMLNERCGKGKTKNIMPKCKAITG